MWNCNWYNRGGAITHIIRVFEQYRVKYIPTVTGLIRYVKPAAHKVKYMKTPSTYKVNYVPSAPGLIRYVAPKTIKIKVTCKQ
jgi:hypothetical protein